MPALDEALRKLTRPDKPSLLANNHALHRLLADGVTVEFQRRDGTIAGAQVQVLDYDDPANNDWLAVNQFTVVENHHNRRPRRGDLCQRPAARRLRAQERRRRERHHLACLPTVPDLQGADSRPLCPQRRPRHLRRRAQARIDTLTADRERFMPWRTVEGEALEPPHLLQLEVIIKGVFERRRFLALVRHFIVFEEMGGGTLVKKMAAYHQFHAVNTAVVGGVIHVAPNVNYTPALQADRQLAACMIDFWRTCRLCSYSAPSSSNG